MARYICPSCGKRYNGKRCSACMYENFSEEFSHGGHTHTGEPLVIDQPARSPIPKKDPFACDKPTKKKRWLPVVLVLAGLLLLEPALALIFGIGQEISQAVTLSNQPQPEVPEWAIPLFDTNGIQLLADFGKDGVCQEEFPLYLRNTTKHKVSVHVESVVVNGFLMEDAYARCQAGKGRTAAGSVRIDPDDLALAGISQIQTLSLAIGVYDQDDYETLVSPQTVQLSFVDPSQYTRPQAPQGQPLYRQPQLEVSFLGYLPGLYDPQIGSGDLLFYLENPGQKPVNISLEYAAINGQEVDLSFWCSLPGGTRAIDRMYLYPLEDLQITAWDQVTELTLTFQVTDPTWETEPWTIGPVSLPLEGLDG